MFEHEDGDVATLPTSKPKERRKTKSTFQPPYHVILLNDDDHSYDYVILMMMKLFGHSEERAYKIADTVHHQGRAICKTTHKEVAEFKRDQIMSFGADPAIPRCQGSMSATIEPAR